MGSRYLLLLFTICCAACGDCGDRQGNFFEPETFGTYEFVPEPDLAAPRVLDFGGVERGARVRRQFDAQSVGRLPLEIFGLSTTDPAFTVVARSLAEDPTLEPGDAASVEVEFTAGTGEPVRAGLDIDSNDPDEPTHRVVLLANQITPCVGAFVPGQPVWEVHDGEGPMCWPSISQSHGNEAEYSFAEIPAPDDAGWEPEPDNHISFERRSSLCGTDCACRGGGDFTYFQTFVYLPEGARLREYKVVIRDVDDGARVTVLNTRYPAGITDPSSYARIPGGSTSDLARYLIPGSNRIVITHVDDCCRISRIRDVRVTADGEELDLCVP